MTQTGRTVPFFALVLAACLGTGSAGPSASDPAPEPTPEQTPPAKAEGTEEPTVSEPTFVDGPAIAPSSELASWLGSHKGSLLRLPIVLEVTPYDVGDAVIGMKAGAEPADAVKVSIDQGALSVALHDHLGPLCGETPKRCAVWLQGYWGPTVSLPGPPGFDGPSVPGFESKSPFSVRKVIGLVKDGDTAHVKVVAKGS